MRQLTSCSTCSSRTLTGAWIEILFLIVKLEKLKRRTLTGAWIEITYLRAQQIITQSRTLTGAWIEMSLKTSAHSALCVAPSRVRGLKLNTSHGKLVFRCRRTLTGAWIEIFYKQIKRIILSGRTLTGAWIEMCFGQVDAEYAVVAPSRVRGLK